MYPEMKSVTFMGWEVRAALEGRKTEFRRVVEPGVAYWVAGENLFVRENFARGLRDQVYYRSDPVQGRLVHGGWIGAPHMKYSESRLTLQIVAVRQEPLQAAPDGFWWAEGTDPHSFMRSGQSLLDRWIADWDRTHPRGQRWDDNPTVWVVSYKRL